MGVRSWASLFGVVIAVALRVMGINITVNRWSSSWGWRVIILAAKRQALPIAGLHRYCGLVPLTIHGCRDRSVVVELSRSHWCCQQWSSWSSASTVVVVVVSRGPHSHQHRLWLSSLSSLSSAIIIVVGRVVVMIGRGCCGGCYHHQCRGSSVVGHQYRGCGSPVENGV